MSNSNMYTEFCGDSLIIQNFKHIPFLKIFEDNGYDKSDYFSNDMFMMYGRDKAYPLNNLEVWISYNEKFGKCSITFFNVLVTNEEQIIAEIELNIT